MDLILKTDLITAEISNHEYFKTKNSYIAGYFADLAFAVKCNVDFIQQYRHVQYFGLEITEKMFFYLSKPNYAPKSLIEQLRLTGDDKYFKTVCEYLENNNLSYKPSFNLSNEEDLVSFNDLLTNDRADLTQRRYNEGEVPEDIYCTYVAGCQCLEIVKVMMKNDFIPSDDVIIWYLSNGMGEIARQSVTKYTDTSFFTEAEPIDLDSLLLIEEFNGRVEDAKAYNYLINIVSNNMAIDCSLFIELYNRVRSDVSPTEKFNILSFILEKKDNFAIYTMMKLMLEDNITESQIENHVFFVKRNYNGYLVFKIQIEKVKNVDIVGDVLDDIFSASVGNYYSEDKNGFISAQNEKYSRASSSDESDIYTSKFRKCYKIGEDGEEDDRDSQDEDSEEQRDDELEKLREREWGF